MTTRTLQRIKTTKRLNELAIESADRNAADLKKTLERSKAATEAAFEALRRAGLKK
jgi:hypothetical protein